MRALTVTLVVLCPGLAVADQLAATRGQAIVETSHRVTVELADGVALYKVQRTFKNRGKVAEEAGLAIDLPARATATNLRIKTRSRWHDGLLMERAKAAALYRSLTGMGAYEPKDPALLQWLWDDKLYLQVFPLMPGGESTVEYTLTVPTEFSRGTYWVSYPRIDASRSGPRALVAPAITVKPAWPGAKITLDDRAITAGEPVTLAVPERPGWAGEAASFAASALAIPASSHTRKRITSVELDYAITHTYRGDLHVDLVTPAGVHLPIHANAGGADNNLVERRTIALPAGTVAAGTWRLVVEDQARLDTGTIDRFALAFGSGAEATAGKAADTPIFIPDSPETDSDAGVAMIGVTAPPIATWTARLGRVEITPAKAIGRLEIDTPAQLSQLPKRAQVVFLVDASHSAGEYLRDAQLATLRAYLAHIPDAEVEIIAYRRRAVRVFNGFVPAAALETRLAAAITAHAFALGNGSALDEAGRLAATALASRTGPRRVVALTDGMLRPSFDRATGVDAFAAVPADAVVHVVMLRNALDDRITLEREANHFLTRVAEGHHGIMAHLHGIPVKPAGKEDPLVPVVLELVRPTRIEGVTAQAFTVPATLHEGDGVRAWVRDAGATASLTLEGRLWSDPVKLELAAAPAFSRATAAFVFGAGEHDGMSPAEMMTIALLGRAVSPVTSYVAFEPGTRPMRIGLRRDELGEAGGLAGGRVGGVYGISPDLMQVRPTIAVDPSACVKAHKPPPQWRFRLAVETTRNEIVDVSYHGPATPFTTCLVDATWAVRLDHRFHQLRDHFDVDLR